MKLSIIVPVYNEHKTIKEVLNKLSNVDLGSKTLEKEIIIVEGNSKDGTREIVESFNKNNNFKIIVFIKRFNNFPCSIFRISLNYNYFFFKSF